MLYVPVVLAARLLFFVFFFLSLILSVCRGEKRRKGSHGDALSVPLVHQKSRRIFFFFFFVVRNSACSVCGGCGLVASGNDDGRRGGGRSIYLFPFNSNLND